MENRLLILVVTLVFVSGCASFSGSASQTAKPTLTSKNYAWLHNENSMDTGIKEFNTNEIKIQVVQFIEKTLSAKRMVLNEQVPETLVKFKLGIIEKDTSADHKFRNFAEGGAIAVKYTTKAINLHSRAVGVIDRSDYYIAIAIDFVDPKSREISKQVFAMQELPENLSPAELKPFLDTIVQKSLAKLQ